MDQATAAFPTSNLDPFSTAYLADPHPAQEALREAGPVVRLTRYNVWAVARYEQVFAILNDWRTFSSARGAGLTDFKKEKPWRLPSLVLETDPPLHDRTRKVLDSVLSPAAMRGLRARFAEAADRLIDQLLERGSFDAVTDIAEAYPLEVFPDAVGMPRENRRYLLPYGNMVFNSFGPRNAFFEEAVHDAEPVLAWVQAQSQRDALSPDGFGAAVHAAADAGLLTADEAPAVVRSILTAGNAGHVGFGYGIHQCVGQVLARMEGDCILTSLARKADAIEITGPIERRYNNTLRGLAELPIRLRAA
jgi:4-methoxybenzoate monooxygenase (O-demethylating)